jgi:hypothetical protein
MSRSQYSTDFPRKGPADIEFSKLTYSLRKYKNEKNKTKEVSKYSTLQEAVQGNISTFEAKKSKLYKNIENGSKSAAEAIKRIEEQELEYILDIIPFVSEYGKKEVISEPVVPKDSSSLFHVSSKNTNNNTFLKYLYNVEHVINTETIEASTEKETTNEIYTCSCGGEFVSFVAENHMACDGCGMTKPIIESYTFSDQNEGAVYKRINHLTECLNALQGKEGTNVPQEVIEAVKAEFKKNRISMTSEIKPDKVKQYLKKLGFSKYYENIHTIAYNISKMPPMKLSKELEKKFKDMFVEIQDPFFTHKDPKRKNFLSYNYVLYKFAELLGEDDLLCYFPLLKCSKNLHSHDMIWKKICKDLSWEFIATV